MTAVPNQVGARADPGPFEHVGMLYHDTSQYVAGTTRFVRDGLAAGSPVLVAVPNGNEKLIRDGLGGDAADVRFVDMADAGRNPGRIIPGVLLDFAASHSGRRVSIIGEPIWPGRTPDEYPACATHEALINAVFAGRDAAILCPYDARRLDPTAVADAHRTHPVMASNGHRWASDAYTDPVRLAASFNRPLPPPPPGALTMSYQEATRLAEVRRFVTDSATAEGLPAERADDLAVAVNELATNSLEHATGTGRLSLWRESDVLICQVDDCGHLADPLVGRIPPARLAERGRGLLIVNQLADLVRMHTRPGRTTIRLYAYLGRSAVSGSLA